MKPVKTKDLPSGTKLPILDLKGKDYLQVAWRLVWFREDHPRGKISTEIVSLDDGKATVKATISVPDLQGGMWLELASGHKTEHKTHFPDFLEKAETGAIGRALAAAGYGTQFEPDFDEADRIVDSPLVAPEPAKKATKPAEVAPAATDRDRVLKVISERASAAIKLNKATLDQIKTILKNEFGVDKKEDLSDTDLKRLYDRLNKLIA